MGVQYDPLGAVQKHITKLTVQATQATQQPQQDKRKKRSVLPPAFVLCCERLF